MHAVLTSPYHFNKVWTMEWTKVYLATRKAWEKVIANSAGDYPHPEVLLEETALDNLRSDVAGRVIPKKTYGKDRKQNGYHPAVGCRECDPPPPDRTSVV